MPSAATLASKLARTGPYLRKLEAAGLVSAAIEVSEDGKAMKFYDVTPFALQLTPKTIMVAVQSLSASNAEAEK